MQIRKTMKFIGLPKNFADKVSPSEADSEQRVQNKSWHGKLYSPAAKCHKLKRAEQCQDRFQTVINGRPAQECRYH